MQFYLGTHVPQWVEKTSVPLFLSHVRIERECRTRLPRALGPWCCDSSAYSQLALHGRWTYGPARYVEDVRRYRDQIGNMQWASVQDWMCEPWVLAKTGLSVAEHQTRTVDNYSWLLNAAPEIPWVPVLQGWTHDDYLRHQDLYLQRGYDLRKLPIVGLGSVCRRQHTDMAETLIRELTLGGIRLHGFGFKTLGLIRVKDMVHSSDSMAWSYHARKNSKHPACVHPGKCGNCLRFALRWRARLLCKLGIHPLEDLVGRHVA